MAIPLIIGATLLGVDFSHYTSQDVKFMLFGSIVSFIFFNFPILPTPEAKYKVK